MNPSRRKRGEPFHLLVQGGDTYQSLDEAMAAGLPIPGKIIADTARRVWQRERARTMGRRRKALQSSLELMEDQYFKSQDVIESYHRLAQTLPDQLVTGRRLELLDDLGEHIQASVCYSHYIYRHPEEWPVCTDDRERVGLEQLVRGGRP